MFLIIHWIPSPSTPCCFLLCLYTTSAPMTNCPLLSATVPFTPSAPSSILTETLSRASRACILETLELLWVLPLIRLSFSETAFVAGPGESAAKASVSFFLFRDFGMDGARLWGSASVAERSAVKISRFLMISVGSSLRMLFSSSLSLESWRR